MLLVPLVLVLAPVSYCLNSLKDQSATAGRRGRAALLRSLEGIPPSPLFGDSPGAWAALTLWDPPGGPQGPAARG